MKSALVHRLRLLLLLLADAAMIYMEIRALRIPWRDSGLSMLRFYTNSSNLFALAVCILSAFVTAWTLISGRLERPAWTKLLRHTAATCLMITFLIAAFVLVPSNSRGTWLSMRREFIRFMLKDAYLHLHTLCPLVLLFSFSLLDDPRPLSLRHTLWPVGCTLVYGLITLFMVGTYRYGAPYPFFQIHSQPVYITVLWCTGILAFTCAISWSVAVLNQLSAKLLKRFPLRSAD